MGESRFSDPDMIEVWIMRKNASETIERLHERLEDLKQEKEKLQERLQGDFAASSLTLRSTPGLGPICHVRSVTAASLKSLEEAQARLVSSSKSTRSFYVTDWSRLASQIDHAILNIRNEEQRLFRRLRQRIITNLVKLRRNAAIMDELDVAASFAALAKEQAWVRPIINNTMGHKIIGGRHPTVKLGLEEQGRSFVSNDLILDRDRADVVGHWPKHGWQEYIPAAERVDHHSRSGGIVCTSRTCRDWTGGSNLLSRWSCG